MPGRASREWNSGSRVHIPSTCMNRSYTPASSRIENSLKNSNTHQGSILIHHDETLGFDFRAVKSQMMKGDAALIAIPRCASSRNLWWTEGPDMKKTFSSGGAMPTTTTHQHITTDDLYLSIYLGSWPHQVLCCIFITITKSYATCRPPEFVCTTQLKSLTYTRGSFIYRKKEKREDKSYVSRDGHTWWSQVFMLLSLVMLLLCVAQRVARSLVGGVLSGGRTCRTKAPASSNLSAAGISYFQTCVATLLPSSSATAQLVCSNAPAPALLTSPSFIPW